jgi:hypothetical protein
MRKAILLAAILIASIVPASAEDARRFETECGDAYMPPEIFSDLLCLGLCTRDEARVACRHSESRGNWYDGPATNIESLNIKIVGMVDVEDLARQLEGLTRWKVVVESLDEEQWVEEGEWRVAWSGLSELRLTLDGWGAVQIVANEDTHQLVLGSALLTPEDYERELRELNAAAKSGDALAAFDLGVLYFKGEIVLQSDEKAVEWWRRAAKGGSTAARTALGGMYLEGRGVKQSDKKAAEWYRRANAGVYSSSPASKNLCSMFYAGKARLSGLERENCMRMAANRGVAEAQYDLGREYAKKTGRYGYGDIIEAYFWLSLAAAQDYKDARNWQKTVGGRLTADELAAAEARIREWKPAP